MSYCYICHTARNLLNICNRAHLTPDQLPTNQLGDYPLATLARLKKLHRTQTNGT